MRTMRVELEENSYPIVFGDSKDFLKQYKKAVIITDENVHRLHGGFFDPDIFRIVLPCGESTKTLEYLSYIYEKLHEFEVDRSDLIIAFGGGVIGDIAGFAAATYKRGIDYVQIPTTLLAQVDSSVGGKTGINLPWGKNLAGCFYQPKQVLINTVFLKTLPPRRYAEGMAEIIKYAAISDKITFEDIENEAGIESIVASCCLIKKEIVERDQYDLGERIILNFGHTMGHAVERYYNYEKYTHGEGVAIGMYAITVGTERLGITKKGTASRIKELLVKHNLPCECDAPPDKLCTIMQSDKKAQNGSVSLVVLKDIGEPIVIDAEKGNLFNHFGA